MNKPNNKRQRAGDKEGGVDRETKKMRQLLFKAK